MSRYTESHLRSNLAGPGDARPTALQIIADEHLTGKLSDKVFLITGVSSGIGIETLRALHSTGAHVIGTVRNLTKGSQIVDDILKEKLEGGGLISLVEMDLESFSSIKKGATAVLEKSGGTLNVIVANAGIMGVPHDRTVDGWERQFATNYLGHFLLFQLLKDALLSSATAEFPSRYVSVSSHGHCFGRVNFDDYNFEKGEYSPWKAYGQSKTAALWMSNAIERKYGGSNLHSTSLHPGGIRTNLTAHLGPAILEGYKNPDVARYLKSPEQGAATQVYAAVSQDWKDRGGSIWLIVPEDGVNEIINDGHAEWAYDEEGEDKLWRESFGMVELPVEI
ncbi:hypothetical protein BCR34DRAFT_481070 [Clohesyomyces aquaticus]|uniref:Short-chain dehydrogenase n=1 Tax=Clohesyomyces aquaticus TaxID=1231657 RepID=A0A1Y1ZT27_9PLEO|nr:hypothetical protein BCR34DRAFT_481070 [Clohesyomyces aquaticus]